jgi:hypothetical protein
MLRRGFLKSFVVPSLVMIMRARGASAESSIAGGRILGTHYGGDLTSGSIGTRELWRRGQVQSGGRHDLL